MNINSSTRHSVHTYFAFLRGINVGGKNIIPMAELRHTIASLGFTDVRTWIASGNVRFETEEGNLDAVKQLVEQALARRFNYPGPAILRRDEELVRMVGLDPFGGLAPDRSVKWYVCLLENPPEKIPELPLVVEKEGLEIFRLSGRDLFLLSRELKGGRYGFPNNYVEAAFDVRSTARNWNTVVKMVKQ